MQPHQLLILMCRVYPINYSNNHLFRVVSIWYLMSGIYQHLLIAIVNVRLI